MNSLLKKITPASFRFLYHRIKWNYFLPLRGNKYRILIINHLNGKGQLTDEEKEIREILTKSKKLSVMPYKFAEKYKEENISIKYDAEKDLFYTEIFDSKKLFFKRKMTKAYCKEYINHLICEQDPESPHCYLSTTFNVSNESIVVDAGTAEGYFVLSVIDKIKKAYLFEPDPEWLECLYHTYAPWKDKIEIIPKFISDNNTDASITFDEFFRDKEKPTFIKVDIEGFEKKLLDGGASLLETSPNLQMAICTYHNHDDYIDFSEILTKNSFCVNHSPRYMLLFYQNDLKEPYLRRGVIRAEKCVSSIKISEK